MGWAVGYDSNWQRDIGYGVPAKCDHPECDHDIDRGLSYVCGGEPFGGEHGCGLYFCSSHLLMAEVDGSCVWLCARCSESLEPFDAKPDVEAWINHKLTDPTWAEWRTQNPEFVKEHGEAS